MVDIHCHILPEVDDGPRSWDTSLEMCSIALADGITHIVATPHANHEYAYDRERHLERLRELQGRAPAGLSFSLGCDFHFSYENVEDAIAHPERYAISGTSYLLIELSDYSVPPAMTDNIFKLSSVGLKVILTHPERNPILQANPQTVLTWANSGCIVQVTAGSILGFWGKVAKKTARWLMDRDAVHVLASDAHDPLRRPPVLSEAVQIVSHWTDHDVATAMVLDNPRAIVNDEKLPFFPNPRM
jgi:protein-tyrosine phosphatase